MIFEKYFNVVTKICLGFLFSFSFIACEFIKAKDKEVEKIVRVNAWGKEFVIKPIAESNEDEKKWSRSVAIVEYLSGGSGTGFFISADGLFITNQHVVSRNICNEQKCGGLRIIRGFSEDGDNQIYYNIRPIVQSQEFDFALLKVELPAGESVPYLKLNTNSEIDYKTKKLIVIGHPLGGPAKVTPVDFESSDSTDLVFRGPSMWGNSGSPVIDISTGMVLGLNSYIAFNSSLIESNGDFTVKPGALVMSKLFEVVRKAYPMFQDKVAANDLENLIKIKSDLNGLKDILPRKADGTDKLGDSEKNVHNFVAEVVGTADEAEYIQKLFESNTTYVSTKTRFGKLVEELNDVAIGIGKPLIFNQITKDLIEKTIQTSVVMESSSEGPKIFYKSVTGQLLSPDCLNSKFVKEEPIYNMIVCHSKSDYSGKDVMNLITEKLENVRIETQTEIKNRVLADADTKIIADFFESLNRYYLHSLGLRLKFGPLNLVEKANFKSHLETISKESTSLKSQFRAQTLLVMLAHQNFEKAF